MTLSLSAFSQCEYDQKGIDEFTGSDVAITKFIELYADDHTLIKVQLMRVDSFYSIVIGMNIGKEYTIHLGSLLMLIMETDSVFAAQCLKPTNATYKGGATAYMLNLNGLDALYTYGIKKIRIYTSAGYVQRTITKENMDAIKAIAACL